MTYMLLLTSGGSPQITNSTQLSIRQVGGGSVSNHQLWVTVLSLLQTVEGVGSRYANYFNQMPGHEKLSFVKRPASLALTIYYMCM